MRVVMHMNTHRKRAARVLLGALIGLAGGAALAQPSLTVKDYDNFYSIVILKAQNGAKGEWLASYDPVVNFIARVRQDVEQLPDATQRALAKAVHDNGYWKGQEIRVRNAADPFLGAKFKAGDERLKAVLTPQGYDAFRSRYAQGARGYRFTIEAVADRAAFYKLEGKNIPGPSEIAANTTIVNANAQSWDDLVADAASYPEPRRADGRDRQESVQCHRLGSGLDAREPAPYRLRDGLRHCGDLAVHGALQR